MNLDGLPTSALTDVEAIIDHDLAEAGVTVADRFLTALSETPVLIRQQPGIGSTRLAHVLQRPTLWVWPMHGFPYLVCYRVTDTAVEIWRIVHMSRDIPATLRD